MKFQYIGSGDAPPRKILFMGRVPFELDGMPVDVTDPEIITKLLGNQCFVSEAAAADPDGDYVASQDDDIPEFVEGPIITDLALAELPPEASEPAPEMPVETPPLVPVETKYAKPRGRPKGASTRT